MKTNSTSDIVKSLVMCAYNECTRECVDYSGNPCDAWLKIDAAERLKEQEQIIKDQHGMIERRDREIEAQKEQITMLKEKLEKMGGNAND